VTEALAVSVSGQVALVPRNAQSPPQRNVVPVIGLAYKDDPADGRKWLASNGDPYKTSIVDRDGRVGIDFGVYGVPETFVIDKSGIIRYKQIGPLTADALDTTILPLVRKLQQS